MIVFQTLGELSLTATDGRRLQSVLAQPRRVALLAYLASPRTPEFVSRSVLLGLFWPERDEERARSALRNSLYLLRRSLEPDVLVSRGVHHVGLDPGHVRCDAAELEAALEAGDDASALDRYRGDYLQGLVVREAPDFERWAEGERRRFRLGARDAARRLAQAALAHDDIEEAELRARRAAALDPWDEGTLQLLMRVLTRQGNRAGALRAYERFATRAREELRLEPSADTEALAGDIRNGRVMVGPERLAHSDLPPSGFRQHAGLVPARPVERWPTDQQAVAGPVSRAIGGRGPRSRRWLGRMAPALLLAAAGAILAYRWGSGFSSSAPSGTAATKSIAVLPLENLIPDTADAYVARAMTDELTSALSVVPGFLVVGRTSASRFAGSVGVGSRQIADSLGVRYLIEGNVLRTGDSLAITTRLVDGHSSRTLWTRRFAQPVGEAPNIQVDIARRIAASLRSSFTKKAEETIEAGQTQDPAARDLFLRAEDLLTPLRMDSVTNARVVRLLSRAVALDSTFAAAWFRLGVAFEWEPHGSDSSRMAYDRAIRLTKLPWLRTEYRALRAEYRSQRDSALTLFLQAVRLNPRKAELVWDLSQAYKWREDLPDALVWERRARNLDPLNPTRWDALGTTYLGLYLDRRAERAFRRAVAIDSANPDGWGGLINLQILERHYSAALALADTDNAATGRARDPVFLGRVYLSMGKASRARTLLERALRVRPWRDMAFLAPEIVHARLATGDTAGADSLARRAEATLRRLAASFKMSPGMPSALVELAAVRGDGAEAARRLRGYVRLGTLKPFRWLVDDADYGAVRSDTAFEAALGEVRAHIMSQRQEALHILNRQRRG